jgi:adenylate kinase
MRTTPNGVLRLIILGAPASGKSTLTRGLLDAHQGLGHFAVRLYFAEQIRLDTDLGRAAEPYAKDSAWLPDEMVIEAVRRRFDEGAFAGGMILEGLPATTRQAELLDALLCERQVRLSGVLYLEVPDEVCVARALSRRVCTRCDGGVNQAPIDAERPDVCARCGCPLGSRGDDEETRFRLRLAKHRTIVTEALGYYPDSAVVRIDGLQPPPAVLDEAVRRLSPLAVR